MATSAKDLASVHPDIGPKTLDSVARYAAATTSAIDERLAALDREWHVERVLAVTTSLSVLVGIALGALVNPLWLWLPAVVAVIQFAHAVLLWNMPSQLARELGLRSFAEIGYERYALKALRGDFHHLAVIHTPEEREAVSRFEDEGGAVVEAEHVDAADPTAVEEALRAVKH
jgi:hypothetical protein